MPNIIFNNSLTYATGKDVLSPLITALFDQDLASSEYQEDLMSKMGFKATRALTPDQKFSIIIGAFELSDITEGQDIPDVETGKGADKGFEIKQYGGKIGITKLFRKWIETSQTLEGADSSVKSEWARLAQNIINLRRGQMKNKNIDMTALLTSGWSSANAFWPGSVTPYGQPLFSASHPYKDGSESFSNLLSTADGALTSARLQDALDGHKSRLRLQNGDRVMTPSSYSLITGRELAVSARELLNTSGNQVNVLSGAGTNSAEVNQFAFNGNKVELVENPFVWYVKKDGSAVGTENNWFLCNCEGASIASAMRRIDLYDAEVNVYTNDSNNNTYVSLDLGYAVDHYGLESFVIGSRGTVA
jgi:hypothetical protein